MVDIMLNWFIFFIFLPIKTNFVSCVMQLQLWFGLWKCLMFVNFCYLESHWSVMLHIIQSTAVRRSAASMLSGKKPVSAVVSFDCKHWAMCIIEFWTSYNGLMSWDFPPIIWLTENSYQVPSKKPGVKSNGPKKADNVGLSKSSALVEIEDVEVRIGRCFPYEQFNRPLWLLYVLCI